MSFYDAWAIATSAGLTVALSAKDLPTINPWRCELLDGLLVVGRGDGPTVDDAVKCALVNVIRSRTGAATT